jgi:arylsulfatase A-like enzyme
MDDNNNYFDNLLLVDRTIGEIRSALEMAKLWDQTTLLITSDHPLRINTYRSGPEWDKEQENAIARAPDRYVPYMLKLAAQTQGLRYSKPFTTLVTKELMFAILSGKIVSYEDAVKWFEQT